jgi:hypothetical protein
VRDEDAEDAGQGEHPADDDEHGFLGLRLPDRSALRRVILV